MSDAKPKNGIKASIVAVGAGFLATALLSVATDAVLHATGVFPPMPQVMSDPLFALATAYRIVYTIVGGYITARLAPERPMRHVLILGAIGTAAATLGCVATWNHVPSLGPHWYPVALVVTALPSVWAGGVWAGGRLRALQTAN